MEKYLEPEYWKETGWAVFEQAREWLTSPAFLAQVAAIVGAIFLALILARQLKKRVPWFANEPAEGRFLKIRQWIYMGSDLLFSAAIYLLLGIAAVIVKAVFGADWLVLLARGASIIYLLYSATDRFVTHPMARTGIIWIGIPLATLQVFGYYDDAIALLDNIAVEMGNIRLSLLFLIKTAIAGGIFFWLGRVSNSTGQRVIRNHDALDKPTKELFAKLLQIALFGFLFIMLMQVLGLDLTALTVFGGAVGVGLGFGLQQIASNFISGLILLLERSLGVGDYIELEGGKQGILKELNMRSATLETFDGKEIMVPNEKFITSTFLNWTRDDPRQRYEVEFRVAYDTDLSKVPPVIEEAVRKHPSVLLEPEKPDCELRGFGENGVEFAVEFWVDGLDDGPNKFSSDVLFLVWEALRNNGFVIPPPRREIHVLSDGPVLNIAKKETVAAKPAKKPAAKAK